MRAAAGIGAWRHDWMSPARGGIDRDSWLRDFEPLLQAARIDQVVLVRAAAPVDETR